MLRATGLTYVLLRIFSVAHLIGRTLTRWMEKFQIQILDVKRDVHVLFILYQCAIILCSSDALCMKVLNDLQYLERTSSQRNGRFLIIYSGEEVTRFDWFELKRLKKSYMPFVFRDSILGIFPVRLLELSTIYKRYTYVCTYYIYIYLCRSYIYLALCTAVEK